MGGHRTETPHQNNAVASLHEHHLMQGRCDSVAVSNEHENMPHMDPPAPALLPIWLAAVIFPQITFVVGTQNQD